jgi:predicted transcriptional regulator
VITEFTRCREVMNQRFAFADGLMTVSSALEMMREKGITKVIINRRDNSDEFGMVKLSDIAKKVIGKDRAPERVNLYEIMCKPVISVRPQMNIKYCARLFDQYGLTSAIVIEDEHVIGMVSYKDIVLNWANVVE